VNGCCIAWGVLFVRGRDVFERQAERPFSQVEHRPACFFLALPRLNQPPDAMHVPNSKFIDAFDKKIKSTPQ